MSGRDLRRRVTAISNSRAPPRPSPSLSRRKIRPSGGFRLWRRPSENVKELRRSKSEPSLRKTGGGGVASAAAALTLEEEEGVLYRLRTCTDIFSSSPDNSLPQSPGNHSEGYNKDAKVVINVTVEGSPGPIRTMVKLGSNVEDMINLVVKKYNEEGRTPFLNNNTASTFQLHHSYFSLESFRKSDLIGEIGSRSFYLRKCNSNSSSNYSVTDKTSALSNQLENSTTTLPFFPSFVYQKMKRIIRRTRRIWKIFGCIS
ncbi:hypothetical protein ACP275_05G089700 [Erythranthe tilingii]